MLLTLVPRVVRITRAAWLIVLVLLPQAAMAQSWSVSGQMSTPRQFATTTVLDDGRVLIVGGALNFGVVGLQTVDIHDPVTGLTVAGPILPEPRFYHAAVKLAGGRVAVIGGMATTSTGVAANTIYIFDPVANMWSLGAPMQQFRAKPLVELLPDGRVFVVGGSFGDAVKTAEIYDPATNAWTTSGAAQSNHVFGASTTLADGRILVAGGQPAGDAEIYDPASGTWSTAGGHFSDSTVYGAFVRVPDGRAVLVGSLSDQVDIYDPSTGLWAQGAPMPTVTRFPGVGLLGDGRVLVAGGVGLAAVLSITQIYDPVTGGWSAGPPMNEPHASFTLAPYPGGAWIAAGDYLSASTSIEILGSIVNEPPVANAGADVAGVTCDGCPSLVTVDAGGSSDPEGGALTYTWSIGATVLLTTAEAVSTLPVPTGTTMLTLTVTDKGGLQSTDNVNAVMTNVEDEYRATIGALEGQVQTLQARIAVLETALAECRAPGGELSAAIAMLEDRLREAFGAPGFELPGDSTDGKLQNLIEAIGRLNRGRLLGLFSLLSGQ